MDEQILRKLQDLDEQHEKQKKRLIENSGQQDKTIKSKYAGKKINNKGNQIFLILSSPNPELRKEFLDIKVQEDVLLRVITIKKAVDLGFSVNTFPSVVYAYKKNVLMMDISTDKDTVIRMSKEIYEIQQESQDEISSFNSHKKDKNDQNQINWGGERSTSRLKKHHFQLTPMFFRRNSMPIDIVNLHKGQSIFLMCNGPSMKELDLSRFKRPGIITLGINNGGHLIRPNYWTCVDDPTRFMRSIWEDPTITKLVPQAHFEKKLFDKPSNKVLDKLVGECPNVIGFRRNERFNAENYFYEDTINWGNHKDYGGARSVMISSLRLCHLLGFKNVYLVGCDFDMNPEKKYFFDEDRTKGAIKNNNNSYGKMKKMFSQLKPIMKDLDFNVYNTNKQSKLDVFDFVDLDVVLEENEIDVSESTEGMYVDPKLKGKK